MVRLLDKIARKESFSEDSTSKRTTKCIITECTLIQGVWPLSNEFKWS